jgi:hypothetical protein
VGGFARVWGKGGEGHIVTGPLASPASLTVAPTKHLAVEIVFAAKGKPPKQYKSSAEVKKAVADNPNAIGYIEKSAVDDTVKVIATIP